MTSNFNEQKLKLKYLFTAIFEDGTVIKQTQDDVSVIDPKKRSAFYDVLEYEKKSKLVQFEIDNAHLAYYDTFEDVRIDLKTGLFLVNNLQIDITDQLFYPTEPLKLIYFRETRIETDVIKESGKADEIKSQRFYINRYFVGWETMYNGKKYQRTIALAG